MPTTFSRATNAVVAPTHEREPAQAVAARQPRGAGVAERSAPTSSVAASTAITRPSQNGRNAGPGPFSPQYA